MRIKTDLDNALPVVRSEHYGVTSRGQLVRYSILFLLVYLTQFSVLIF